MRASVRLVCLCLLLGAATGCADARSDSPTAPASPLDLLAAGPGANYDASGSWHFVVREPRAGERGEFDAVLHQDANGNITFIEPDGGLLITLTRLGSGNGRVISYKLSASREESPCTFEVSGTATLDTKTDTGRAAVRLSWVGDTGENCDQGATQTVTFSKKRDPDKESSARPRRNRAGHSGIRLPSRPTSTIATKAVAELLHT
jgi:hypothetical protein